MRWICCIACSLLAALSAGAAPLPYTLEAPAESDLNAGETLPEKVSVTVEAGAGTGGGPAIRVTSEVTGTVSVPLVKVPLEAVEDTVIWYTAQMRCKSLTAPAYLELLCEFPGRGKFFSRALEQSVTGDADWRTASTPFYLKKGQRPSAAYLGIRLEGNGTVWLDDLRLSEKAPVTAGPGHWGRLAGVMGAVLGVVCGLWGALAGWLGSRGKGRRFVISGAAAFLVLGIGLLTTGIILWRLGMPRNLWYGFALSGGIVTFVFAGILPGTIQRYRALERQRMQAVDQSEGV